jgi:RNA polymerase sigma-70 factor, ECF subfamily
LVEFPTLEDAQWVALALAGEESAYRELLARYQRPVYSLILRMVQNREEAEDLAQDAFLKAFHALDRYNPQYRFSSWMFKIAHNVTVDHLRKRKGDFISLSAGAPDSRAHGGPGEVDLRAPGESPQEFAENRALGRAIDGALAQLRPEFREAILLRHVQGHSYEEVAEIMDLPLGTVKTFLHRGRSELRTLLEEARG